MKPLDNVIIDEAWLIDERLQSLFNTLEQGGGEVRVAGGAVRNSLMRMPTSDIDLSTTLLPDRIIELVEGAGHKAIPTGIEHGTVTIVIDGKVFEVTTLREDIETDGRHAVVRFGTDWQADAERRDLTINGLYCDREGRVYDYIDGFADIGAGMVRFIGDANARIKEDALRILRFYRFFAWYGSGRPDATGIKACSINKDLLSSLPAERIWMEFRKLLGAKDSGRSLLWMRTTGILTAILPESENWGIDGIPGLVRLEKEHGWEPDYLLRLMAMVRPHEETVTGISNRLKLSNVESERLVHWARTTIPGTDMNEHELSKALYQGNRKGILDALRLEAVHLVDRDDAYGGEKMALLANFAEKWDKPEFPVKGQDLLDLGHSQGRDVGDLLAKLEAQWIESDFNLSKYELLETLRAN